MSTSGTRGNQMRYEDCTSECIICHLHTPNVMIERALMQNV